MDSFLEHLPKGAEQKARLCARGIDNAVTRVFCGDHAIGSLEDVQTALGLSPNIESRTANFALLAHTTSLSTRSVSAINPRAIFFRRTVRSGEPTADMVTMGFARGEPIVELAAVDDRTNRLDFYLLEFETACTRAGNCTPADLFLPAIERDWLATTLYQDEDLKNTVLDCTGCHQPGGPAASKILLMRELRRSWTHFFGAVPGAFTSDFMPKLGSFAVLDDFRRAHGTEGYAGVPAELIGSHSGPVALQNAVESNGFKDQPIEFPDIVNNEVIGSSETQPRMNVPLGQSATWEALRTASLSKAQVLPVPYHDWKVTDPSKLPGISDAYRAVLEGTQARVALEDLRSVFLAEAFVDLGFSPPPAATGSEVISQMCSQCHHPDVDPSLSRAQFDASKLDSVSRAEKDLAIARMLLPESDRRHMPPVRFRVLSTAMRDRGISELRK